MDENILEINPNKPPLIIAMKGHPGTGKSTLARQLASSLRLPLIDKDDIRDSTAPVEAALAAGEGPAASQQLLNNLSYDVVWRIAATQLRQGLGVIVDSPLSRRAHLDRLVGLAAEHRARLFVVECQPRDEGVWRTRVEGRAAEGGGGWHKPATWRDMERLMEGYGGCTEYDVGDVPRIVVDTTEDGVRVEEIAAAVVAFIASHGGDV